VLLRLAGDAAPLIPLGGDGSAEMRRALWNTWWQKHESVMDLTRLHEPAKLLGHTLLVFGDAGRIAEIDLDGKTRWQIDGLGFPLSAQVVAEDRVLVAEYRGQRVTERSTEGKVLWEKKVAWPIAAQRLTDGTTFIATRNQLIEIDKTSTETRLRDLAGETFMSAQKLRNGNIACITSGGVFLLLDPAGKELRRRAGGLATDFGCGFDGLPNGNLLIPETRANRVAEYDAEGKIIWSAATPAPLSALRLPNGNTLAACPRLNRVVEVDRDGRIVWEHRANGVTRASRR